MIIYFKHFFGLLVQEKIFATQMVKYWRIESDIDIDDFLSFIFIFILCAAAPGDEYSSFNEIFS